MPKKGAKQTAGTDIAEIFAKGGLPSTDVATAYDDGPSTETTAFPFNTLSNKGRRFTIKTPDEREVKGKVGAGLSVIVLGSAPFPNRTHYADGYDPDNPQPPTCTSTNGKVPDAWAQEKQSRTCKGCKHNQPDSHPTGNGKACSTVIPAVIVPVSQGKPVMKLAACWRINATSAFEKNTDTDNMEYSFMALNKVMKQKGFKLPQFVLEIKHDEEDEEGNLITFKPTMGITKKIADVLNESETIPVARMLSTNPDVIQGIIEPDAIVGGYDEEEAEEVDEEEEALSTSEDLGEAEEEEAEAFESFDDTAEEEAEEAEEEEEEPPKPAKRKAAKKKAVSKKRTSKKVSSKKKAAARTAAQEELELEEEEEEADTNAEDDGLDGLDDFEM